MAEAVFDWCELQSRFGGDRAMHTYQISYSDGTRETIKAASFRDIDGLWIEFLDGQKTQLLRVRADMVSRIEITAG